MIPLVLEAASKPGDRHDSVSLGVSQGNLARRHRRFRAPALPPQSVPGGRFGKGGEAPLRVSSWTLVDPDCPADRVQPGGDVIAPEAQTTPASRARSAIF